MKDVAAGVASDARLRTAACFLLAVLCFACGTNREHALVMSGSAVGAEARVLRRQLARFNAAHPADTVELRVTPDAADQRHQLYVQWLNAQSTEPDVLQLDVIWTPEFAAAGWVLPLDRFALHPEEFFSAGISANRWKEQIYAVPWFMDVGMLYWRTDLLDSAPATFESLQRETARVQRERGIRYGLVWQGARYEGLVTVFLEYLGGFGGRMLDDDGRVVVNSAEGVRALRAMWNDVHGANAIVPEAALAWQEEQTRFAFQNGDAVLMRNWPYAASLLADASQSRVAGHFGVAPMPAAGGGVPSATLGGSQLAINARSRHPEAAFALIEFLTAPEQMIERMREVGQYPSRPALYDTQALADVSTLQPRVVRSIIEHAVPRPVTPVYMQLSETLQGRLHGALTGQQEPEQALDAAAREMTALLERTGLARPSASGMKQSSAVGSQLQ